jgi:hypothetical protein
MPTAIGHRRSCRNARTFSLGKFWRNPLIVAAGVICILCLAALCIPTLDGPNSRRRANEAVAVGKLRRITVLQKDYAASHSAKGFACQLSLLKPPAPTEGDYDPDAFLLLADHGAIELR